MLESLFKSITQNKYILYGAVTFVISEAGCWYFSRWMKRLNRLSKMQSNHEMLDVMWMNEETSVCKKSQLDTANRYGIEKCGCDNKFCVTRSRGQLIGLINNAKYSIDLAFHSFTAKVIIDALSQAAGRGVQVRVIIDPQMEGSGVFHELKDNGILVRIPVSKDLMHHKFFIIDSSVQARKLSSNGYVTTRPTLFTGSLNMTNAGFFASYENMIITTSTKLVNEFEKEFERMWKAFKHSHFPEIENLNHFGFHSRQGEQ